MIISLWLVLITCIVNCMYLAYQVDELESRIKQLEDKSK